jgi:hypothetical protein
MSPLLVLSFFIIIIKHLFQTKESTIVSNNDPMKNC